MADRTVPRDALQRLANAWKGRVKPDEEHKCAAIALTLGVLSHPDDRTLLVDADDVCSFYLAGNYCYPHLSNALRTFIQQGVNPSNVREMCRKLHNCVSVHENERVDENCVFAFAISFCLMFRKPKWWTKLSPRWLKIDQQEIDQWDLDDANDSLRRIATSTLELACMIETDQMFKSRCAQYLFLLRYQKILVERLRRYLKNRVNECQFDQALTEVVDHIARD